MVGWHHQLNGHEFEQTLGDGEGQGSLACCSPWGYKELDTTERLDNNTHLYIHTCVCAQSCLILCEPLDCSLPGSSVHGIFQVRMLQWVAISTSRRSSQPRGQVHICISCCIGKQILPHSATWDTV